MNPHNEKPENTGEKTAGKPRWRKRYLVDTHAQGRFLTVNLLYVVIFSFVLIIILLFPGLDRLLEEGLSAVEENFKGEKGSFIIDRLVPALIMYLILVAAHSIIMTHRIFGPIYRIEQRMIEAAEGNWKSEIHFRKNDYLRGLDLTINKALASFGRKVSGIIDSQDLIIDHIDKILSAAQAGSITPQNVLVALSAIQDGQEDVLTKLKAIYEGDDDEPDIPRDESIYL